MHSPSAAYLVCIQTQNNEEIKVSIYFLCLYIAKNGSIIVESYYIRRRSFRQPRIASIEAPLWSLIDKSSGFNLSHWATVYDIYWSKTAKEFREGRCRSVIVMQKVEPQNNFILRQQLWSRTAHSHCKLRGRVNNANWRTRAQLFTATIFTIWIQSLAQPYYLARS